MAQSIKCPTYDFRSSRNPSIMGSIPQQTACAVWNLLQILSLPLPLPLPCSHVCAISLSKINKSLKKEYNIRNVLHKLTGRMGKRDLNLEMTGY